MPNYLYVFDFLAACIIAVYVFRWAVNAYERRLHRAEARRRLARMELLDAMDNVDLREVTIQPRPKPPIEIDQAPREFFDPYDLLPRQFRKPEDEGR
ncbi:MAG: hypothetical protein AMS19_14870 [Gemmatimonas sp. SG8_23]|nr:MAG: hypothetical protein AMS19_14870 [Gemmatimonas sp. SG8_23]